MKINDILVEFASGGSGDSGNYFKELASAWYNGTFDTGSLQKGIKSQQDVERLLNRGIVAPDGKMRKYHIDYNSDFDGVEIYSDDYYEYGDHDDTIDSRTGQKWGPYDFMAFSDEQLDESAKYRDAKYKNQLYTQEPPDYNDTREYDRAMFNPKPKGYPGRKKLPGGGEYDRTDPLVRGAGIGRSGIKHNINLSGKRKGLPSRDQITSLKQSIKDISGQHTRANLPEQGMAKGSDNRLPQDTLDLIDEYIAKVEPYADRNEMIQDVVRGTIHTSELEYALQEGVAEGFLNEKSTSQAQFRTMAAAAHNPEFAKKVGIKQSVAREFNKADTGQDYKDLPKKANEGATVTTTPGSIEPGGAVDNFKQQMANNTERDMAEGNRKSEPPEADYGDDYQDMVKRVKKLAGVGQLKTQYDPARRVYRNMPTAVQPKK